MAVLDNSQFLVNTVSNTGVFNIISKDNCAPILRNNNMAVSGFSQSGKKFCFDLDFFSPIIPASHLLTESRYLRYSGMDEATKIKWDVEFRMGSTHPIVLWRMVIKNLSDSPIFIDKLFVLKPKSKAQPNLEIRGNGVVKDLRFYSHGWQSWSHTGAYRANDRMRHSRLGLLQEPMVINPGTPIYTKKGEFSSDFFGVVGDAESRDGFVLGFLSQSRQFGTLTAKLHDSLQIEMWANGDSAKLHPMDEMETDWAAMSLCSLDDSCSVTPFLDAVSDQNGIGQTKYSISGWCSWYYYYQNISETIIQDNVKAIYGYKKKLAFDLIQIDDGYQKQIGDWLEFNPKFPGGIEPIARMIKANGFIPGIWIAPFILHPKSQIIKDHPDWVLRKKNGRPARAGFVWNSLAMALDLTVPGVLEHVRKVIKTAVTNWGFTYLKLDFLYAAALKGEYYDDTKTHAQVLREGLQAIREAAGEQTIILGCGLPLGSALGLVDTMRIGADVGEHWLPSFVNVSYPFKNEPHMPSVENSIHNTITRSFFQNVWWVNDPDCLLVRDDSSLSFFEVQTLATIIGMTSGVVLLSDDMTKVSEERMQIAKVLIPPINQRARVMDWMETGTPSRLRLDLEGAVGVWHLISFTNWEDHPEHIVLAPENFGLDNEDYFIRSFWTEHGWFRNKETPLFDGVVQPNETVLLAIRKQTGKKAFYAGSNLHLSQGLEIKEFNNNKKQVDLNIDLPGEMSGYAELTLPDSPKRAIFNDKQIEWKQITDQLYRFNIIGESGLLSIHY